MGIWEPYVNGAACKALKDYKYHSSAGTVLDNLLNTYWWNPVSELVPTNVHPNVLTVSALASSFFLGLVPFLIWAPEFASPCPRWLHILVALGFFVYQTLDAIDGKQARRTSLSSPTGQLMDHGCDSLTTFFAAFAICASIQLGTGPAMAVVVLAVVLQLYLYTWYECTYGIFRSCTGKYMGVTEGQFVVISLNVVAAINPGFWKLTLADVIPGYLGTALSFLTLRGSLGSLTYIVGCSQVYRLIYEDIKEICISNPPKNIKKAVREWLAIGLQLYCTTALLVGGTVQRYPFMSLLMIACAGSLVAWRLIISSVSKAELRVIQWPSLPFIVTSICSSCRLVSPRLEAVMLLSTCAWTVFALGSFVWVNMTSFRDYLRVPLFVVPAKNIKSPVKAKPQPSQSMRSCSSTMSQSRGKNRQLLKA